jgi:hypothetical protein
LPPLGYKTLIEKLKLCIDDINPRSFANNSIVNELMLWLLFISGVVDLGYMNRTWHVVSASKVASALQLQDWGHVKTILIKFFVG